MKAFIFLSFVGFFSFFSYQPPDAVEQVQAALEIAIAEPVEVVTLSEASDEWWEIVEEEAIEEVSEEGTPEETEGVEDVSELAEEEEVTEEVPVESEDDEGIEIVAEGDGASAQVEVDGVEVFEVPVIVVDPLLVLDQEEESPVEEGSIVAQLIDTVE